MEDLFDKIGWKDNIVAIILLPVMIAIAIPIIVLYYVVEFFKGLIKEITDG